MKKLNIDFYFSTPIFFVRYFLRFFFLFSLFFSYKQTQQALEKFIFICSQTLRREQADVYYCGMEVK